MDRVRQHFEEEAQEFDRLIVKLIPDYQRMLEALVRAIPFESLALLRVIDLGGGREPLRSTFWRPSQTRKLHV